MAGDFFTEQVLANASLIHEPAPRTPYPLYALENMPGLTTSVGFSAYRGSNTIMRGGYGSRMSARSAARYAKKGTIRRTIANNNPLNPRNYTRFRSASEIFSVGGYTPFNAMDIGNRAFGFLGKKEWLGKSGQAIYDAGDTPFTRGMLSNFSAAGRIGRMSDARFAKSAQSIGAHIGRDAATLSRGAAQQSLLTMGSGRLTQQLGGFMSAFAEGGVYGPGKLSNAGFRETAHTLQGIRSATTSGQAIGLAPERATLRGIAGATRSAMGESMGRATGFMARTKAGAKIAGHGAKLFGGKAALMASGVGAPIAALWMAYDVGKLAVASAGYAARTTAEAYDSFRGDLNRAPMGNIYKDTEAAATSRARGVTAIQNSRLNARSVLGSEAGALAAHFG